MMPAFLMESPDFLFLAKRDEETCPSWRRHLMFTEVTNCPYDSWGKAVSVIVHSVIAVGGPGPRVAAQRTSWLMRCPGLCIQGHTCPAVPGDLPRPWAGPAVGECLLGHSRGFP